MSKRPLRWFKRKLAQRISQNNWGANRRDIRCFTIKVQRTREAGGRARYNLYYRIFWDKGQVPEGAHLVNNKVNPRILELDSSWIKALLSFEQEGFLRSNMSKKEFRIQVALGIDPEWSFICPVNYREIKRVDRKYSTKAQRRASSSRGTVVTFA